MITEKNLIEMKSRLKIFHTFEDDHIKNLLEQSYSDITEKCGEFFMDKNERGKELVFERTRYAYNDAIEYFDSNFQSMILSFALDNTVFEDVQT